MGRKLHYRPGSWYRVDDRTGFPQRAERTRKQWDGLIVDQKVWEPRQPQDLVRGVRDHQAVPDPRPLTPATFDGPIYFTLADTSLPQAYSLTLTYTTGMSPGDKIGVILEDGSVFNTIVASGEPLEDTYGNILYDTQGNILYDTDGIGITGTIGILNALPISAPSGNLVIDYLSPNAP